VTDPEPDRDPVSEPSAGSDPVAEPVDPSTGPGAETEVEVFPPTLREVMLRPQWIGMLLLCLVVAGVFAWLGQWQLGRAILTNPLPPGATEEVLPLDEVAAPAEYLPEPLVGQRVSTEGSWVPGDFLILQSRFNDGVEGYWVTGQLRLTTTEEPTSLAVAIGWAPTEDEARAAAERLEADVSETGVFEATGRLISDEGPTLPPRGADPQTMARMSPAALLGLWHDAEGLAVYRPYLALTEPQGGLVAISSPAPDESANVNWLNIFYAAEWAIFAGFAFYLWYRLARDAWEKEVEDLEDAAAEASDPDNRPESRG
jgi:cytochrome oxidase assembly protein ShyY1